MSTYTITDTSSAANVNTPLPASPYVLLTGDQINITVNGKTTQLIVSIDTTQLTLTMISDEKDSKTNDEDKRDVFSNKLVQFIHFLLNGSVVDTTHRVGRNLYVVDLAGNKLRMAVVSASGSALTGEEDFVRSSITLAQAPTAGNNIVLGLLTSAGEGLKNRNVDMGFYTKVINSSNFTISHTDTTYYTVGTVSLDSAIEFNEKFVEFVEDTTDYFTKPPSFIVSKSSSHQFSLKVISSGLFMLLDPNAPVEYAINQLRHAQDKGTRLEKRSARRLYNQSYAPIKGRYNGWGYNNSQDLSLNLYDSSKDIDISANTLKYLWITVYNLSGERQRLWFNITDKNSNISSTYIDVSGAVGRQVLWMHTDSYNGGTTIPPSQQVFSLLPDSESRLYNITSAFGSNITSLSKWDLLSNKQVDGSLNLYLESFGYSTDSTTFQLATRQMFDARIPEEQQVSLDRQTGYDMLYSRFINNGSLYPMDAYNTSATFADPSTDAQVEEALHASQGWYFNNTVLSGGNRMLLQLVDQSVAWNNLHTMFIEVLVNETTRTSDGVKPKITAYGATNDITATKGHRLWIIKGSPFDYESLTDKTLGPYFPQISSNLQYKCDNIMSSNTNSSDVVNISIPCDIEILSYGWKEYGKLPVHYQTRWHSTDVDPLVRSLENYILITKDAQIDIEQPMEVNDAVFHVKAFGDFVDANYEQNANGIYGDIRVNAKLNKPAIENALYILENASLNNYTINSTGLRYTADTVAIVDCCGSIIYKQGEVAPNGILDGVMIPNKYIIADFQNAGSPNLIQRSTYIKSQSNNQDIFALEGGLAPVVLEGVYAALFKEFNKSGSIINTTLCSNIRNTVWRQVNKPAPIQVTLSATNATLNMFTQNVTYRYKVTYAEVDNNGTVLNNHETDASEASNQVTQGLTCKKIALSLVAPVNVDPAFTVNSIRIYRERGLSGKFILLKQLEVGAGYSRASDATSNITFYDDNGENNINATHYPPTQNAFSFQVQTGLKLTETLVNEFNENAVPSTSSTLFKLYEASGRLAKDNSIYGLGLDKRRGGGTKYDASGNEIYNPDLINQPNTITMNLENMELRFKIKMNGSIFDASGSNLSFSKEQLSKQLAEIVFGKYNNGTAEPQTLVRVVKRTSPTSTEGIDEKGHIMTMLNNQTDGAGNYIVNTEIQYEIIFKVSLVQKSSPHIA